MASLAAACLTALFIAPQAHAGCGSDPLPCNLPPASVSGSVAGTYHVATPPTPTGASVVFLHGHGGSGAGTLSNTGMVDVLLARGYTVIAPDGQMRAGTNGHFWDLRSAMAGEPQARNDAAFVQAVADDAAARFGLRRDGMLLSGFSVGGSMVSYIACATPVAFAAYAPVAGSFWQPQPQACTGAVRLLHTHGWADLTVPLEGRVLRNSAVQGDVFQAMQTWRLANGCDKRRPDAFVDAGEFKIRQWTDCAPGTRLDFALHFGGHTVPQGWAQLALDWFESLP